MTLWKKILKFSKQWRNFPDKLDIPRATWIFSRWTKNLKMQSNCLCSKIARLLNQFKKSNANLYFLPNIFFCLNCIALKSIWVEKPRGATYFSLLILFSHCINIWVVQMIGFVGRCDWVVLERIQAKHGNIESKQCEIEPIYQPPFPNVHFISSWRENVFIVLNIYTNIIFFWSICSTENR